MLFVGPAKAQLERHCIVKLQSPNAESIFHIIDSVFEKKDAVNLGVKYSYKDNIFSFSGPKAGIDVLWNLIDKLDSGLDDTGNSAVFKLENAASADAASVLKKQLSEHAQQRNSFVVIPEHVSNSVIILTRDSFQLPKHKIRNFILDIDSR